VNSNILFTIDEDGAAVVVTSLTVVSTSLSSLSLSLIFFFTLWTAAAETAAAVAAAGTAKHTTQPLSLIDRLLTVIASSTHGRGRGGGVTMLNVQVCQSGEMIAGVALETTSKGPDSLFVRTVYNDSHVQ
jgi:hypothetical protein